jgi:hypothetical protein
MYNGVPQKRTFFLSDGVSTFVEYPKSMRVIFSSWFTIILSNLRSRWAMDLSWQIFRAETIWLNMNRVLAMDKQFDFKNCFKEIDLVKGEMIP